MAYRDRTRHVPSPLNLTPRSPPPLLYDLPNQPLSSSSTVTAFNNTPKSPKSPPRTPRVRPQALLNSSHGTTTSSGVSNYGPGSRSSVISLYHPQPYSASQQGFGGTTPNTRSTTATPTQEMEMFAKLCHSWYFQQDADAGKQIQELIRTLPASQRAAYTRIQSQVRSSYHTAVALRKDSEFHAHLTSTRPGQSLAPMNRQEPASQGAKQERLERVQKFISVWATSGNVGTKPFFEGLYAILRLQGLPENLGGAGGKRIAWEVDDAVFKESAGKEFMLEAVDILKGVLGFEEAPLGQLRKHVPASSISSQTALGAKDSSRPIPPALPPRSPPPRSATQPKRRSAPPLPTIASASVIERQKPDRRSIVPSTSGDAGDAPLDDNDVDTFADPISASPTQSHSLQPLPRRNRNTGSLSHLTSHSVIRDNDPTSQSVLNRDRSPSDPFDDTHGQLSFGHGRRNTHGSLGSLLVPNPSPSMTPLIEGTGSSVGTGTSGESHLANDSNLTTSGRLKKNVPLPSEGFELSSSIGQGPLSMNTPVGPDSDEEEDLIKESESNARKSLGLGFMGKGRRGSETTGLGLLASESSEQSSNKVSDSSNRNNILAGPKPIRSPPTQPASIPMSPPQRLEQLTDSMAHNPAYTFDEPEPYLRIWLVPSYLCNPEIGRLLNLFPTSVSRGSIPRFKGATESRSSRSESIRRRNVVDLDLEAQVDGDDGLQPEDDKEYLRHGTGRMWISSEDRDGDWRGSMWERFLGWWRRIFC